MIEQDARLLTALSCAPECGPIHQVLADTQAGTSAKACTSSLPSFWACAVQVVVHQLGALLLQANGDASSPAGLQTTAIMQHASLLACAKMRLNPVSMRKCVASHHGPLPETGPIAGLSQAAWRGVADAMGLSKEQRQSLCSIRRLYLRRQGSLIRTRKQIITQISQVLVVNPPDAASVFML